MINDNDAMFLMVKHSLFDYAHSDRSQISDALTTACQLIAAAIAHWNYAVGEWHKNLRDAERLAKKGLGTGGDSASMSKAASGSSLVNTNTNTSGAGLVIAPAQLNTLDLQHVVDAAKTNTPSDEPVATVDDTDGVVPLDQTPSPAAAVVISVQPNEPAIGTMLAPIAYAFESTEHYGLPVTPGIPVVVHDGDIGSIIAYALTTLEYEQKRVQVSYCLSERQPDVSVTQRLVGGGRAVQFEKYANTFGVESNACT
jgi:hypothetical protein